MTYAGFLLIFLVVPILLLAAALRRKFRRRHALAGAIVCALAFLYTAPWDNHAARIGLWTFDSVFAPRSHFLGFLPWEEYAFYGLQSILICLLTIWLAQNRRLSGGDDL
ncbi:hypothetical protein CCAX7_21610 [Capsulimonas corticalis]|uniref:Uncharacterized protein n=1 Tax=Capsulimonas corticalis TaxID=2219043 RepID=A0A402D247_9BACT|nr:lycopene cyclase domain-containing protein [Capsulimonas corticalis]BDI30110.1 hypothetical protein CCAX7_21610 [Capsulimonas corticalis]